MNIPKNYFQFAEKFKNGGRLTQNKDQFGYDLETELHILFLTENEIYTETEDIVQGFSDDDTTDETFIPENAFDLGENYPLDKVLCFGLDGSGSPFAMDFSQNDEPRIIYFDDGILRWRVIANDINDFFALFAPDEE